MKHTPFFAIAVFVAGIACNEAQKKTDDIMSFIPGTYVRSFQGEYSFGHDTLFIAQPDKDNNFYTIRHNSSFQRVLEKKVRPIEYKSELWTAIFNKESNMLLEQKKGKQIHFFPKDNSLMLGTDEFKKIE
jgi:hypothetical protein